MRNETGVGADLRRFRRKLDFTQEQMAERLKLKRTTYTSYEDERANLPPSVLSELRSLGFGLAEVSAPQHPQPVPVTLIPRGPSVPCSDWSDPLDASFADFEEVDSYMAGKGRFACDVIGDSMYDLLWPGDKCVWQSSANPKLGTVVLATNGKHEATVAQLKHDGTDYVLHKLNAKYPPVTADHWECKGFLVGIIRIQGSKRVAVYDPEGIRP